MNNQTPEKQVEEYEKLDIQDIFLTIQGEGPFQGERAIFIRLAGCNLQCPGCDTDYTSNRKKMNLYEILKFFRENNYRNLLVVITGGEPFRQNISLLCWRLFWDFNCRIQIETNGTLNWMDPITYADVTVVCSPKTPSVNKELQHRITAYKYVISADSFSVGDGLPITVLGLETGKKVARPHEGFKGKIYIQPMDEYDDKKNRKNLETCTEIALKFGYILQIQMHKYLNLK